MYIINRGKGASHEKSFEAFFFEYIGSFIGLSLELNIFHCN